MPDFALITACGGNCDSCPKKLASTCLGCIQADGYVPEWSDSGRCKVHACAREHHAQFCGLCAAFPCQELTQLIHWNPHVVEEMTALAEDYRKAAGLPVSGKDKQPDQKK